MSDPQRSAAIGGTNGASALPDFEETDFWLDIKDVKIAQKIGEGQFSSVFIGKYFGDVVAVKKQTRHGKDLEKYLLRELAVLKYIEHPHLLEYIGAWNEVNTMADMLNAVYIVTEYAQGGDLLTLLMSDVPLGWKFRINIARGAASALMYLHEKNLIHRDIKSSNLLLDDQWNCKVSDFGMAREITTRMTICGTDEYMAPELFFDEDYGPSVDIFSFGMVLLELVARRKVGEQGFAERRPATKFELDVEATRAAIPGDAPESAVILALQCCDYSQENRPPTEGVFEWLQDLMKDLPDDDVPPPPVPPIPDIPETPGHSGKSHTPQELPTESTSYNPADLGNDSERATFDASDRHRASTTVRKPTHPPPPLHTVTPPHDHNKVAHIGLPQKAGWLYKRNKHGFRNWKRRWFVLVDSKLMWYRNMHDPEPRGMIKLPGTYIKPTKENRWQILDVGHEEGFIQDAKLFNRELSAQSPEQMEEWVNAINQAILRPVTDDVLDRRQIAALVVPEYESVEQWLRALELSTYWPLFEATHYTDMNMINNVGLDDKDLDLIGITIPIHRRILKAASCAKFSETLQVTVPAWRDFGSVIVYKVCSKYKFATSAIHLRYSDFNKFNSLIRQALQGTPLLQKIPPLPGKGNRMFQDQRDPSFISSRRVALEEYMQTVVSLLTAGKEQYAEILKIVLNYLDLEPVRMSHDDGDDVHQSLVESKS